MKGETYKYDGREGHSLELYVEFVAGLELCGWLVWSLGRDGADEPLCPLRYPREVKELCSFRLGQLDGFLSALDVLFMCRLTTLRKCAGEQAISVVVVIKTMAAIVVFRLESTRYLDFCWMGFFELMKTGDVYDGETG